MKKIISAIVLAVTLLCSSISVMAADKDVRQNSSIDPLAIATGAVPINSKVSRGAITDYRFDASELHYEIRNNSNELIRSGNLGDLVKSTEYFIIDEYTTFTANTKLAATYEFYVYPEGQEGFTINYKQMYLPYCDFGDPDARGFVEMKPVVDGKEGVGWIEGFTREYGKIHYGEYSDSRVKYRLRVINANFKDIYLMRLNLVLYDYYQQ